MRASSYQSRRGKQTRDVTLRIATGLLSIALLTAAKPYRDTKGRFEVELADGWALAPQFGDVLGMRFERSGQPSDEQVHFVLHVDSVSGSTLESMSDAAQQRYGRGRRLERIDRKPIQIKSGRWLRSQYRTPTGRAVAFVSQLAGQTFVGWAEFPKNTRRFEPDVRAMLDTVRRPSKSGVSPTASPLSAASRPAVAPRAAAKVVGRWESDAGVVFILAADGRFQLGSKRGQYELHGSNLRLLLPGKSPRAFEVEVGEDRIVLRSNKLKRPGVYWRKAAERSASTPKAGSPIGSWRTQTPSGPMVLDIRRDGSFSMGAMNGTWTATPGQLTLEASSGAVITYKASVSGGALVLEGGDLPRAVTFEKSSGS